MEITQPAGTRIIRHRRLVIIWIFLLYSVPYNIFAENSNTHHYITYEDAGRLPPIYQEEIELQKEQNLYKNPLIYFCFLPGIIIFIILLFLKKRKTGSVLFLIFILCLFLSAETEYTGYIEKGIEFFLKDNYHEALKMFKQAENLLGPLKGICYNNALCYYHLDKKGYAIFELYRAIKKGPMEKRFAHALRLIENECGLLSQINAVPFIHPDIPFISMAVLFNITCIALGLVFRFKKGNFVIIFVLLAICTIGAAVMFIATEIQVREKICIVISRNGLLKQIPLPSSRTWVLLKEGTSLKVLGNAKGYYLVKTGRGLKGWIREADVKVE